MNPHILGLVPWDAVMPAGPQTILIALSVLVAALSIWFVSAEHKRRNDWVPVFAFVGGGLAVFYEPLGDILVSVLYPIHGQIGWIDVMGRKVPLFIGVLYFWYMSVPAIYFLRQLEHGLSAATLWRNYALVIAIAIGIEIFGVSLDAWVYYGSQPYVVFGVPLWAPFTYGGFVVTICVGLHAMATNLDRRHHWLIVPAIPMFMGGGHCILALPAALAMFTTDTPLWIWLGATVSIALSLLLVYVVSLVYCSDRNRAAAAASSSARRG